MLPGGPRFLRLFACGVTGSSASISGDVWVRDLFLLTLSSVSFFLTLVFCGKSWFFVVWGVFEACGALLDELPLFDDLLGPSSRTARGGESVVVLPTLSDSALELGEGSISLSLGIGDNGVTGQPCN